MKVLTIATDSNAGGSAISLLNLLKGLKQSGFECTVVLQKEGFLSDNLRESGIKYIIIPTLRLTIWPYYTTLRDKLQFLPKFIRWRIGDLISRYRLNKYCKKHKPDIIHTNVSLCSIGYYVARKNCIPHVWHVREYGDLDFGVKFFPSKNRRIRLLKSSNYISITRGIKEYYGLGINGKVIYNGICSQNEKVFKTPKSNYFLFVGHVNIEKGVSDLIEAFIKYKQKGGRRYLYIAGPYSRDYQKSLLQRLEFYNLDGFVKFLGPCNNIFELMQSAVALIVPSRYEAFGRVTAEAMFNGCLVVGRNTGGTKEQFQLGRLITGDKVALQFESTEELENLLLEIDQMTCEQMNAIILRAQQFAVSQFSNERNIQLTKQYFRSIV